MNDLNLTILVIVIVVYFLCKCRTEGLTNKPSKEQKQYMLNQMLNHKELFSTSLENTKNKLPWVDAVVYEDVRSLIYKNRFDKNNLGNIFM
jgi:hypothetical protein